MLIFKYLRFINLLIMSKISAELVR